MTDNERTERERVEVTQADREAAAEWCAAQPFPSKQLEAPMITAGEYDHHSLVQALARHRIAALRPADGGLVEREYAYGMALASTTGDRPWEFVARDAAASIIRLCAALRAQGQDERAEIVAWLREDADLTEAEAVKIVRNATGDPRKNAAEWAGLVATKRGIADAIEAGQHKEVGRG